MVEILPDNEVLPGELSVDAHMKKVHSERPQMGVVCRSTLQLTARRGRGPRRVVAVVTQSKWTCSLVCALPLTQSRSFTQAGMVKVETGPLKMVGPWNYVYITPAAKAKCAAAGLSI